MDPLTLIPQTDSIPAPAWIFLVLNNLTFTVHILFINVLLGGSLITLYSRFFGKYRRGNDPEADAISLKIPTTFALGINFGVAPLLFLQVIYGHLFYTSSVLMAVYWIIIIPFLILAYYGAYIHIRKYKSSPLFSKFSLLISIVLVLYIALIFTNNLTLMTQPEKWTAYFDNRLGTILNFSDPTVFPRYLHFITASIAIGGLFKAILGYYQQKTQAESSQDKIKTGLKIFAYASIFQVLIGLWFLISIPKTLMMSFMGQNTGYTIVFNLGVLCALGAIVTALANKIRPTVSMLLITVIMMILTRSNLRTLYLGQNFDPGSLQIAPQYGPLILFLLIFIVGLAAVFYMLRIARSAGQGGQA